MVISPALLLHPLHQVHLTETSMILRLAHMFLLCPLYKWPDTQSVLMKIGS